MKKRILQSVLLTALSTVSVAGYAAGDAKLISKDDAIQAAIDEVGGEFLGIRFDEPDTQSRSKLTPRVAKSSQPKKKPLRKYNQSFPVIFRTRA